ncbi:MAG: carbon-nitrogen hydrolase family protein [Bacillota bacterium]|nr:carbon-nitrogen hydrolase family protein [Bacillota bacterium]
MKIALAQMKMDQDMESNFRKSVRYIEEAAAQGAELICFPEIQLTPFFPQYKGLNSDKFVIGADSPYIKEICELCRQKGIFSSPNFYIEENGARYDMSFLIDDRGEILGTQKMVHVAQCEMFYEQDYYKPSEEGFRVFDTKLGKIGIVVCFDRHYPESIRTSALKGAELIIIPTANTSDEPSELFQWEIRIQSFHSSVNIAMCNRVGPEDKMNFCGESIVSDYNGNIVTLGDSSEGLIFAEVDMKAASDTRKSKPYTSLRRKELYV